MSKRADAAALKAYPRSDFQSVETSRKTKRKCFISGYEQAEKDIIKRAVMWLEEHADEYNGSESAFDHMEEEMITDFRQAMEEE